MSTHKKLNKQTLFKFYSSLGTCSADIAKKLIKLGIKGEIGDGEYCPLANLGRAHFGVDITVDCNIRGQGVFIDTPYACEAFIEDFDDGAYPQLEDR